MRVLHCNPTLIRGWWGGSVRSRLPRPRGAFVHLRKSLFFIVKTRLVQIEHVDDTEKHPCRLFRATLKGRTRRMQKPHAGFLPVAPETPCRPLGGAGVPGRFHCWMENTGSPGGRHRSTKKKINSDSISLGDLNNFDNLEP